MLQLMLVLPAMGPMEVMVLSLLLVLLLLLLVTKR
jgi:hypothetical protein